MRDGASCNLVETGRGEFVFLVEVGPVRNQRDQPGRVGEKGAYPSGESGGDSTVTAISDDSSAKATACSVLSWEGASSVARRVIVPRTTRTCCAAGAPDEGTLLMSAPCRRDRL